MLCKVEKFWKKNRIFYDELKCVWDMYYAVEIVMRFGTVLDTLVSILMNSMGLMECLM